MIDFMICCARQVLVSNVPYLNVTQPKFLHSGGFSLCDAGYSASGLQPGETSFPASFSQAERAGWLHPRMSPWFPSSLHLRHKGVISPSSLN